MIDCSAMETLNNVHDEWLEELLYMRLNNIEIQSKNVIPFIQSGEHYFYRGIEAYQKRNIKKAIHFLEKAVEVQEDEPYFRCQLATVLAEQGQYERSNELLQYVLDNLDHQLFECYFFMANNYAYLGFFQKALELVSTYMECAPHGEYYDDALVLFDLLSGDIEDEDDGEIIGEDELFLLRYEHACHHMEKGFYKEASSELQLLIEEYPEYWSAYNHLALSLFLDGDEKGAFETTKYVLEKDSGNLGALCNLTRFYFEKGESEKLAQSIAQLKSVHPLDAEHTYKLANLFCLIGEYGRSFLLFKRLHKPRYENDCEFLHCLAVAAFHCGHEKTALRNWKRAKQLGDKRGAIFSERLQKGELTKQDVVYRHKIEAEY